MKLLMDIIIYIFFAYGLFACIYELVVKVFSKNISDMHNELNADEKVEIQIIFKNMPKYKRYIKNKIKYGEYTNILDVVDEYKCIYINKD